MLEPTVVEIPEVQAPARRRPLPGSSPSAPEPLRSGAGLRPWLLLGAVLAIVVAGMLLVRSTVQEDPHLTQAKAILHRYEQARPEEERNYHNPIYGEALGHLEQVELGSESSSEARLLAKDLRQRIEEFEARMEQMSRARALQPTLHEQRNAEFFEAQRRAALEPVTSFPECEEEGHGRKVHSHAGRRTK